MINKKILSFISKVIDCKYTVRKLSKQKKFP